ncbi:hypothetical protein CDAR_210551 [Caerostris darwini]|uniref:Uncharacterized protein n=1 Tax=Caerostris darwini TaxID=1538125 RepID=A0AAV4ML10_9ARAC|nr:hypothetical protein CDAR_210551 [Caerostris darwini]
MQGGLNAHARKGKAKTFARPSHIQWRAVTVKRPIAIPGKGHSALEKAFSLHTFIAGMGSRVGFSYRVWGKFLVQREGPISAECAWVNGLEEHVNFTGAKALVE